MPVPVTTVDKDDGAVLAQHDVRPSRQSRVVQSVAEASGEEELPHQQFGLRVLATDGCHAAAALLGGEFVHVFPPKKDFL